MHGSCGTLIATYLHMGSRWVLPLLLAVSACAVQVDPSSDPTDVQEGPAETEAPPWYTDGSKKAPDPCVTGTTEMIFGQPVAIPIFCTQFYVDRGDPPPDAELDPLASIEHTARR